MPLGDRLYKLLGRFERVRPRRLAIALALLLVAPTLGAGFAMDDYIMLYQMSRPAPTEWAGSAPFDLFRWTDTEHNPRLMDGAGMAWWTFAQTKVAFMRPVSSLTHALDHALWPRAPFWMHLQNLVWFALLLTLAARLYAEISESRWVAGVATAMFALDSAHGQAVGWISNRNALIGGALGLAALLFHHRRQSGGKLTNAWAAWVCFLLSMFSAELAVGTAGYFVAYALLFERGELRKRLASLLPYATIGAVWLAMRRAGGYGVLGLGAYVDPLAEPLAFAKLLPARSAILLSSQLFRVGSDLYELVPPALQPLSIAYACLACCVGIWFAWPTMRANAALRFWSVGTVLSLLPLGAGAPSDRLLMLVGLGVMPTLAHAMHAALQVARAPDAIGRRRIAAVRSGMAVGLTLIHFVIDPLVLPLTALAPAVLARWTQSAEASFPVTADLPKQTVIVAEIPDSVMLTYLPVMRSVNGRPRSDKLYWLVAGKVGAQYERVGPNMLRVRAQAGLFERWEERSERLPLQRGEHIRLSEFTVDVVEITNDGRPTICDFTFTRPLESPAYVWLTWRGNRLEPFTLPIEHRAASL